jgi:hypothetical protein
MVPRTRPEGGQLKAAGRGDAGYNHAMQYDAMVIAAHADDADTQMGGTLRSFPPGVSGFSSST